MNKSFTVSVPATSANCCVGFDCLGLALDWQARFTFHPADTLSISGCPAEYQNENNLVVQAFRHVCQTYSLAMPAFALEIDSPVPFARGLGSSSCCVAAGVAAADAWFDLQLSDSQMLSLATQLEGHPDNVAPALLGGMTACFMQGDQVISTQIPTSGFHGLAIIPPYEVSTPQARKVLPGQLPYFDAVRQVGHALVFERAMETGDQALLKICCQDHLHEPYRQSLIPDYAAVKAVADQLGLPFWISGSGPTMLMLASSSADLQKAAGQIAEKMPSLQVRLMDINQSGTQVVFL